ncbi:histidine kinase [Leptolyngbya sp. NK1-12]|uniref:histidine kinase n=1 Tax=Leptolyngbya sp. NK1-12 TaxID=2547451 RepID=A0AA96WBA1_9CYAN|nr:histidine kinase [Leptolyngbya sp. NK1-12]
MNPLPQPDVSLYELAVNTDPTPHPLQLSPTTFKSIVGLFLDFLIEQNLPATIWLKLPRGEAWQAEVDRFCQLATAPYSIYSLQTYQKTDPNQPSQPVTATPVKPLSAAANWEGLRIQRAGRELPDLPLDDVGLDDVPGFSDNPAENSSIHYLPLAPDSQLKREYFLLVAAPAFYGLVLTHRPRSVQLSEVAKLGQNPDDSLERKHPLLGICSFEQVVVQKVLEAGIHSAICFGQPDAAANQTLSDGLISWANLQQHNSVEPLDPALLGRLLTKQIQRQEDLWRTSAAQRRQVEHIPQLQRENQELLTALRLKDEFIKTMGLELRTPLATMKTALSLLNSPSVKPPQRQRYMEMLSQECDRQSSLIASVLDLVQLESSAEEMPMESLRLSDIVPGVVSTYQPLAQEKGVMLAYVVPEDLPSVSCLSAWLKQIVINLLNNSIKFTPKGGQVWVRARQQGDSVQLEFRDTGIGIASSDLPRIFERFYRARGLQTEDSNGVGLGLSIVQQLLLRCGGSISVKSKQGEGSVFTVLLPVASEG